MADAFKNNVKFKANFSRYGRSIVNHGVNPLWIIVHLVDPLQIRVNLEDSLWIMVDPS